MFIKCAKYLKGKKADILDPPAPKNVIPINQSVGRQKTNYWTIILVILSTLRVQISDFVRVQSICCTVGRLGVFAQESALASVVCETINALNAS